MISDFNRSRECLEQRLHILDGVGRPRTNVFE